MEQIENYGSDTERPVDVFNGAKDLDGQTFGTNEEDAGGETSSSAIEIIKNGQTDDHEEDGGQEADIPEGEQPQKTPTAAELFGVSEEQLKTEFNRYKADKLFERVCLCVPENPTDFGAAVRNAVECDSLGLGGVAVLPNMLAKVMRAGIGREIYVLVGYPYGADTFRCKKYLLKQAATTKATGVILSFDRSCLSIKNGRAAVREYEKYLSLCRRKKFSVMIDVDKMTEGDLNAALGILADAGVERAIAEVTDPKTAEYEIDEFVALGRGKFETSVFARYLSANDAIELFLKGFEKIFSYNACEMAKSFKQSLETLYH